MKLVLLPGLDGEGRLLAPFLQQLGGLEHEVIELSATGPQDYQSLVDGIAQQLPDGDIALLAESFSGPIAFLLAARCPQVKAVIFSACFLQPLKLPPLAVLALKLLPLKFLLKHSVSMRARVSEILIPGEAAKKARLIFTQLLLQLPTALLKSRLNSVKQLGALSWPQLNQPCLYLQAGQDSWVPASALTPFRQQCQTLRVRQLPATHFLLQTAPKEAAAYVLSFLSGLTV